MSSRDLILKSIRDTGSTSTELPTWSLASWLETAGDGRAEMFAPSGEDAVLQFQRMLTASGGRVLCVTPDVVRDTVLTCVEACISAEGVGPIWTYDRTFLPSQCAIGETSPPIRAFEMSCAVVRARWAVAESGSVWFDAADYPERVLLYAPQHLVAILDADSVLFSLDELYARVDRAAPVTGFLVSGPSKTADIEQHLVVGAQAAKSFTVVVVASPEGDQI